MNNKYFTLNVAWIQYFLPFDTNVLLNPSFFTLFCDSQISGWLIYFLLLPYKSCFTSNSKAWLPLWIPSENCHSFLHSLKTFLMPCTLLCAFHRLPFTFPVYLTLPCEVGIIFSYFMTKDLAALRSEVT